MQCKINFVVESKQIGGIQLSLPVPPLVAFQQPTDSNFFHAMPQRSWLPHELQGQGEAQTCQNNACEDRCQRAFVGARCRVRAMEHTHNAKQKHLDT